ncbi:inositol polyphosphate-5-phosphatase A [Lycorma delicatula]|uniref:inositol polyphosphate-5-phosphatase A n=1 Tax=Lycorma delicatula TaxID=130591 RepID=UPI003F51493B
MAQEKITQVLLVTANVGSIFEDPNVMLKLWTEEFLSTVSRLDPKFLALHCQEVGGKNYEQSMKHVEYFVRLLMTSEELRLFDKVRIFLDEDHSSAESFTALGNFYFIHESITDVLIWDFKELNFHAVEGKEVHSGNIEDITTKEKSKFPQDFFPECKWSRKGFLRTRWNLNGTIFDLVNIHLFHDASNFIAMETFPSVYSKTRQRALEYTLERFHTDDFGPAPFFLFGDFNFRTDTQGVIKKLSQGLNAVKVQSPKNNENTKVLYRDDSTSQIVLTLGKKEFKYFDHQNMFINNSADWLKEFDREMELFSNQLFEFPISFQPSYPFEEDATGGHQYMQTRCPAWCDRVLLSETAKQLVHNIDDSSGVEYGLMGSTTCMGDHKPVYLRADIITGAGRVVCCESTNLPAGIVDCPMHHSTPIHFPFEPPSLLAKRLERTDSGNSLSLVSLKLLSPVISEKSIEKLYESDSEIHKLSREDNLGNDLSVTFNINSSNDSSIVVYNSQKDLDYRILRNNRLHSDGNIGLQTSIDHIEKPRLNSLKEDSTVNSHRSYSINAQEATIIERYVVKRVNSASIVEVPRIGALKQGSCRCLSESGGWRTRSASVSSRNNWRSNSKVKLISDPNLQSSLLRLQSHHSSSEEDWFEEINDEIKEENDDVYSISKEDDIFQLKHNEPDDNHSSEVAIRKLNSESLHSLTSRYCFPFRCKKESNKRPCKRKKLKDTLNCRDDTGIKNCCIIF